MGDRERGGAPSAAARISMPQQWTTQEVLDHIGFGKYQIFVGLAAGVCWAMDACEVLALSFVAPAVAKEMDLSSTMEAVLVASCFVGMGIGSFGLGALSDRYGRRLGFFCTSFVGLVFGLLAAISPTLWMLMICVFMIGFGIGGSPVAFSMFSELTPNRRRGTILVAFELFWAFGDFWEASIAWILIPRFGWRWLVAATAAPMALLLAVWFWLPESPRFLLTRRRHAKALKVLRYGARLNGVKLPRDLTLILNRPGEEEEELKVGDNDKARSAARKSSRESSDGADERESAPLLSAEDDDSQIGTRAPDLVDEGGESDRPAASLEVSNEVDNVALADPTVVEAAAVAAVESTVADPADQQAGEPRRPSLLFIEEVAVPTSVDREQAEAPAERQPAVVEKPVVSKKIALPKTSGALRSFFILFSPELRRTTVLLWALWFFNTFVYYGLVFFTPLFFAGESISEDMSFLLVFVTTISEIPGLIVAFVLIELLGRRRTIFLFFIVCVIGTGLLLLMLTGLSHWALLAFACLSRAAVVGSFDTTYAYTPEVYPTPIRATALGICSAFCRIAGILAPFLPYIFAKNLQYIPISIYTAFAGVSAVLTALLPIETRGKALPDSHSKSGKRLSPPQSERSSPESSPGLESTDTAITSSDSPTTAAMTSSASPTTAAVTSSASPASSTVTSSASPASAAVTSSASPTTAAVGAGGG